MDTEGWVGVGVTVTVKVLVIVGVSVWAEAAWGLTQKRRANNKAKGKEKSLKNLIIDPWA